MAFGNQGRDIYADNRDRTLWLETLGEACEKTGWRIHAWVMLNNHYHLLLETPEANLVAGMKWLQSTYTQRYNSRHEIFGHLFQGRYKAVVVEPCKCQSSLLTQRQHLLRLRRRLWGLLEQVGNRGPTAPL